MQLFEIGKNLHKNKIFSREKEEEKEREKIEKEREKRERREKKREPLKKDYKYNRHLQLFEIGFYLHSKKYFLERKRKREERKREKRERREREEKEREPLYKDYEYNHHLQLFEIGFYLHCKKYFLERKRKRKREKREREREKRERREREEKEREPLYKDYKYNHHLQLFEIGYNLHCNKHFQLLLRLVVFFFKNCLF